MVRFEIIFGSRAVWVNNAQGCLGRFGQFGIDVHDTIDRQEAGYPQCLYCTHTKTTTEDWPKFVEAMLKFHQVDISDRQAPAWLPA